MYNRWYSNSKLYQNLRPIKKVSAFVRPQRYPKKKTHSNPNCGTLVLHHGLWPLAKISTYVAHRRLIFSIQRWRCGATDRKPSCHYKWYKVPWRTPSRPVAPSCWRCPRPDYGTSSWTWNRISRVGITMIIMSIISASAATWSRSMAMWCMASQSCLFILASSSSTWP